MLKVLATLSRVLIVFTLFAIAVDSGTALAGDLIVGGFQSNSIGRYDEATGEFKELFVSNIRGPHSMNFGPDGLIYAVVTFQNQIRRYDPNTGELVDIFVSSGLTTPVDVRVGPDSNLYVLNFGSANMTRYDGQTGEFIDTFIPSRSGGLINPENFVFGPDGHIYMTDAQTSFVHRYNGTTGEFIDHFVSDDPSTPDVDEDGGLQWGQELIFRDDGFLYVANVDSHNVLRFNGETGEFVDQFVTSRSGGLSTPHDMGFGPEGNLFVASQDTHEILRYDGQTGDFIDTFVVARSGGLLQPWSLLFLPDEEQDGSEEETLLHLPANPDFGYGATSSWIQNGSTFEATLSLALHQACVKPWPMLKLAMTSLEKILPSISSRSNALT